MPESPKTSTPTNAVAVSEAFRSAWGSIFGESIPPQILKLLLAHSDLETASFKSVNNYNLGKIIVPDSYASSQSYYWGTDWGPTTGKRNQKFRAYSSLEDGAAGMIRQLTGDTRKEWREGLMSGDPRSFVEHLNGQHGGPAYFEADFDRYLSGFLSRYRKYSEPMQSIPEAQSAPTQWAEPRKSSGWSLSTISLFIGGIAGLALIQKHRKSIK